MAQHQILKSMRSVAVSYTHLVAQDIEQRDYQDMNRQVSPLCQAEDAVLIDSSDMTIEEVVEAIKALCR